MDGEKQEAADQTADAMQVKRYLDNTYRELTQAEAADVRGKEEAWTREATERGELDRFAIYRDAAGEWRWKRVAPNNKVVGASCEGYRKFSECRMNMFRQLSHPKSNYARVCEPDYDVDV